MTTEDYNDVTKDGVLDDTPTVTNILIKKPGQVDDDDPISEEPGSSSEVYTIIASIQNSKGSPVQVTFTSSNNNTNPSPITVVVSSGNSQGRFRCIGWTPVTGQSYPVKYVFLGLNNYTVFGTATYEN